MMDSDLNNNNHKNINWRFIRNVVVKTLILFILFNTLNSIVQPTSLLGKLSAYNVLFPGRERFPFGEDPQHAYNLSLFNFDAMFASHMISADRSDEETYKIFLMGDSSVWGTLLEPQDTIAGLINKSALHTCDGKRIKAYNLGYPTLSLFKDILILEQAMEYEPDLILWLVTLESFLFDNQLSSPIVANNAQLGRDIIQRYHLSMDEAAFNNANSGFLSGTIIGQRRNLADLARLQMYGVMWAATGIDQVYLEKYPPAQRDFAPDESFHSIQPTDLPASDLAFNILDTGKAIAAEVPVWIINEPILISGGENSDFRYNFFYPRWAYDQYRNLLEENLEGSNGKYLDFWDLIPPDQFTNSAIHITPGASLTLTRRILSEIGKSICIKP